MKKRILALLMAVTMVLSCFSGCGNAEEPVEAEENIPVVTVGQDSVSEDVVATETSVPNAVIVLPQASFNLAPYSSGRISGMVYHILWGSLMISPYLGAPLDEMEYRMAKMVTEISETEYEVELYDYIVDSKGNAITAEDVVYSYEYGKSVGYKPALNSYMASVEAVDEYTVKFTLVDTTPGGIESLLNGIDVVDKDWHANATDEQRSQDPATTGAYYVENVTSGSGFVLKANENYWQKDEALRTKVDAQTSDRLTFTVNAEMAMVGVALENKEVDFAEVDGTIVDLFVNEDGTVKEGYNYYTYAVPRFNVLEYNCSPDSPLNNQYLRQAVSYALDSEQLMIAANVPLSMGTVSHDYCNSAGAGYNKAWDEEDYYDYNLEKAKECFELSGYEEGLELHLLFAISTAPNLAIAIQAQLAEIGINVVIDTVEQALYDTMVLESDKWDMATRLVALSNFTTSGWAARFDADVFGEQGTGNFVQDDKLQELLHTAMATQDPADIDAVHYYLKDMCYGYGLYTANKCLVSQDGILSHGDLYEGNPIYNAVAYAEDYVSCAE